MPTLSILIPSRSEKYLQQTIDDIFKHSTADTEVIVFLDEVGSSIEEIYESLHSKHHGRIGIFYSHESMGQRAATNELAKQSKSKYIIKCDAHMSFAHGFDTQMIKDMQPNMVMTAMMCPLRVTDWQILPQPCTKKYVFDKDFVMKYEKPSDEKEDLVETLTIPGSLFMVERENYWKWNLCDEGFGSWGFQGVETALKTWFNGGRVVTNKNTYYGHYFRNKIEGNEEVPYPRPMEEIQKAQDYCKKQFADDPRLPALLEKFNVKL